MVVEKATLVFGGLSPDFVHAQQAEKFLVGKSIQQKNQIQSAMTMLEGELVTDNDPIHLSSTYRKTLAMSLLYKVCISINYYIMQICIKNNISSISMVDDFRNCRR